MKAEILIMKKQTTIESQEINIIRTNPDPADFDMNKLVNQIYKHISQSNKEKLEKDKLINQIYKHINQSNKEKLEKEKELEIKKLKKKTK